MTLDLTQYGQRLDGLALGQCVGHVMRVTGMTIESEGPPVGVGQVCDIEASDGRRVPAEVVGFRDNARLLLPLEGLQGIAPSDRVVPSHEHRELRIGSEHLGRVLDGLGQPLDDRPAPKGGEPRSLDSPPPPPLERDLIAEPLSFGVRALDGLITCGKGQRVGIFSGSGVGKSTLLGEMARESSADVNVLALVGERGREVKQFLEDSLGPEALARSVVVVATADASPIQRVKAAFVAIAAAEHFRDRGQHVLFMMDSLTRFAQAQREIGLAAGEPPTSKGYCPSVFSLLPKLTERLGQARHGSITGIFTILVEGDDMSDPVADNVRALLDGHIVLSRKLAEQGHYPAIDILQSVSRLMPHICSPEHLLGAQRLRAIYSTYQIAEDMINIGAYASGSNPKIDKAVSLIDGVNDFLTQPTGQRSDFDETVRRLTDITSPWDFLSLDDVTDSPELTAQSSEGGET